MTIKSSDNINQQLLEVGSTTSEAKKQPPHKVSDVFIIESLRWKEEEKGRSEGRVLCETLRLCGKQPRYYCFRTNAELAEIAKIFRKSNYRFLHFASHGSPTHVELTMGSLEYHKFARFFRRTLNNRRAVFSSCQLGNEIFGTLFMGKNPGLYSVIAPCTEIIGEHSAGLWSAFYAVLLSQNAGEIKNDSIREKLGGLCQVFGYKMHFCWRNSGGGNKIMHEILGEPSAQIENSNPK